MNPHILTDPWRVQLTMLNVRREYPDDKRNATPPAGRLIGRQAAAEAAAALAEANRAAILAVLAKGGAFSKAHIAARTGLCRQTVAGHLETLHQRGGIASIKIGRTVHYLLKGKNTWQPANASPSRSANTPPPAARKKAAGKPSAKSSRKTTAASSSNSTRQSSTPPTSRS